MNPQAATASKKVKPARAAQSKSAQAVQDLVSKAAYLPLFSLPSSDPGKGDKPIGPIPFLSEVILTGVSVNEAPHRFRVVVDSPTSDKGLSSSHEVGEQVADIAVEFRITPNDFEAGPGRWPPPTLFLPVTGQRFTFPKGKFSFLDTGKSGFRGFGSGHTFPISVGDDFIIRVGAVILMLEGLGKFEGLQGCVVVNGIIKPPQELKLFMVPRVMDPNGVLTAKPGADIRPLQVEKDPDPDTSFLFFLSEPDPDNPITVNRAADGRILSVNLSERLQRVTVDFDITAEHGIRSKTETFETVGTHRSTLVFDPDAATETPVQNEQPPFEIERHHVTRLYSVDDVYSFHDDKGRVIGTLQSNIREGRAFRTEVDGAANPVYRVGGAGPFLEGTGQFAGVVGMASVNGCISLDPPAVSNLYMLRIIDPQGNFKTGG